ncbi:MAG: antibiotic biosynthesis monooxygenase family protein [Pseudomonadota bacterium]
MTVFIATLQVNEEKQADFEKLQTELSELAHAQEPDMFVYDVIKHREKPGMYVVYARFKDEAAFEHHMNIDFHDRLVPPILECLDAEMQLEFFDHIA